MGIDDINVFYNSRAWRRKSKEIIQRDRNECQMCKRRGKYSRAVCVHHVKEIKKYPELAMDDGNLMALCSACHNEVHYRGLGAAQSKSVPVTDERW